MLELNSPEISKQLHELGAPIFVIQNLGQLNYGYNHIETIVKPINPELASLLVALSGFDELKSSIDELTKSLAEVSTSTPEKRQSALTKVATKVKDISTTISAAKTISPFAIDLFEKAKTIIQGIPWS
ncbi:MAG: hypothetical protein ACRKFN_11460 [Desulfitobacterium sp.]